MKRLLIYLLLLKAVILALFIIFYPVGLSPDEAQYWTWSRDLAWGYYSKPPAIAWQIWATTTLFGHSEFGIRVSALAVGFFLALAVYSLARKCGQSEKIAFWAAIAMACSPLGVYLSLAATTDGGAILFLVMGIAVIAKGLHEEKTPNYPLAGVWILLGALYKWTAFALWPFVLFFMLFFPKLRKWSVLSGILISLIALLPPIYWNSAHEWATFKHVGGALGESKKGNVFDFLAAQIGLLSPIFYALLVISFRKQKSRALLFCAAFPFASLFYIAAACFTKMQPNWAAYLYPPGMVLIAWAAYQHRFWAYLGTALSVTIVCIALLMPWYTFRQAVGWDHVASALQQAGYNPETDFLMGDKYQAASILSFYGPAQKRAYFFNISHTRKNQFSYWPQMQEQEVGKTGYFVVLEKTNEQALSWYKEHYLEHLPYFKHVSYAGAYPLYFKKGVPVKYALVFKCEEYSGEAPTNPDVY